MPLKKDVYNAKIKAFVDEIPDIANLATNAALNTKIKAVKGELPSITTNGSVNVKITEVKGEIPNITNLATFLYKNIDIQYNTIN